MFCKLIARIKYWLADKTLDPYDMELEEITKLVRKPERRDDHNA